MLQLLADFFVAALTAIALENVVFARGLGPFHLGESAPQDLVVFGALVTGITTLSSVLCWAVDTLLKPFGLPLYVRSIAFLLCICILYFGSYAGLAKRRRVSSPNIRGNSPAQPSTARLLGLSWWLPLSGTAWAVGSALAWVPASGTPAPSCFSTSPKNNSR